MKETVLPYSLIKTLPQLLCFLTILLLSSHTYAACSNPLGTAGEINYNSSEKLFQYCDDTDWLRMNQIAGSGTGGCTNPTGNEGSIVFNVDHRVLQGCAGNSWQAFGPVGGNKDILVFSGPNDRCVIDEFNELYCWGRNVENQLGDNTTNDSNLDFVQPLGGFKWKDIATSQFTSCGITTEDRLYCWGLNTSGEAGQNNTTSPVTVPSEVNGGGTWKAIEHSGRRFGCAIRSDDTLHCWGQNSNGFTGQNTTSGDTLSPSEVSGGGTWKQLSLGYHNSCAIRSDDTLHCWGWNSGGITAQGTTSGDTTVPTEVSGGGSWLQVEVDDLFACGIQTDNTLWCWGAGGSRLGINDSSTTPVSIPTQVTESGTWVDIALSTQISCALKSDNTLWCAGREWNSPLTSESAVHVQVEPNDNWVDIFPSQRGICGKTGTGQLKCFGQDIVDKIFAKQYPNLIGDYVIHPTLVAGGHKWQKIESGNSDYYYESMSCGLRDDGNILCWGRNSAIGGLGALGTGNTTEYEVIEPQVVQGGHTFTDVGVGGFHACGLRTDGAVLCWGYEGAGRLGNGTDATSVEAAPVLVSGGHTFTKIAIGPASSCGIRTDQSMMCWGAGSNGRLGNGTNTTSAVPVLVSGGHSWAEVDISDNTVCAVRTDGVGMCWGDGTSGQLGNGANSDSNVPVVVSGGHTWSKMSGGYIHSCGVRTDGVAMCWGEDWGDGNLGDGNFTSSNVPVVVSGGYTWTDVKVAGTPFACGLIDTGEIRCWGYNDYTLGIGDDLNLYGEPAAPVGNINTFTALGVGDVLSCGIVENGDGYCWGYEIAGEAGNMVRREAEDMVMLGCASPPSAAGKLVYNSAVNVMQYCDNLGWVGMGK